MIWQVMAQKYSFHLSQEAWHSLGWRMAPARVNSVGHNGCIWEGEGLDALEMCAEECEVKPS